MTLTKERKSFFVESSRRALILHAMGQMVLDIFLAFASPAVEGN
jgi:hypothetical protein